MGAEVVEKKMFGGLAFLAGGHMAVAASGQGGLLVRVDPDDTAPLVAEPEVERMEMGGRSMNGWLRVDSAVVDDDADLRRWVEHGLAYARSRFHPSSEGASARPTRRGAQVSFWCQQWAKRGGAAVETSPTLAHIYDSSYRRLVAQLYALSGSQQEAEMPSRRPSSVLSPKAGPLAGCGKPEAWLRTVALNHLRNRWRHRVVRHGACAPRAGGTARPRRRARRPGRGIAGSGPGSARGSCAALPRRSTSVAAVCAELDLPVGTVKSEAVHGERLGMALTDAEEAGHA